MDFNLGHHKWEPLEKTSLVDMRASEAWNIYVTKLEQCKNVEEIQEIQKTFKEGMMNIALDLQCRHEL